MMDSWVRKEEKRRKTDVQHTYIHIDELCVNVFQLKRVDFCL